MKKYKVSLDETKCLSYTLRGVRYVPNRPIVKSENEIKEFSESGVFLIAPFVPPKAQKPVGDKKPVGENKPEENRKPDGDEKPVGENKPEENRKPDGDKKPEDKVNSNSAFVIKSGDLKS